MKRITAASTSFAAATLVSATALLGGGGALASEPLRLNAVQMDAVTAGIVVHNTHNAIEETTVIRETRARVSGVARGDSDVGQSNTYAATAVISAEDAKAFAQTAASAAGDFVDGIDLGSLFLIIINYEGYAEAYTATSGVATNDADYLNNVVHPWAWQGGGVGYPVGANTTALPQEADFLGVPVRFALIVNPLKFVGGTH